MKKYLILLTTLLFLQSCKDTEEPQIPFEPINEAVIGSRVNLDATSPELSSVYTVSGDTITFYGNRDKEGAPTAISSMEIRKKDGYVAVAEFNEAKMPISISTSTGVTVDLDWIDNTKAAVKAYNPQDNSYINTIWILGELPQDESQSAKSKSISNSKATRQNREATMSILPEIFDVKPRILSRGILNEDVEGFQEVHLWITQCDASYNSKSWLELRSEKDNTLISRIYESYHLTKGSYIYEVPISSYPTSYPNEEWCKRFDNILNVTGVGLQWLAGMEGGLAVWLNWAAVTTGVGAIPAVVVDALVVVTAGANLFVQCINDAGGISNIMQSFNPEWYYKEVISSDLIVIPHVLVRGNYEVGEKYKMNALDGDQFIHYNIEDDPIINSFILQPAYPNAGQGYTATADYHCMPSGSKITLSIIGTDGYTDSKTEILNSVSGTATLSVPGAASGVYDVCTVTIVTPEGETYSMQASLVFGS